MQKHTIQNKKEQNIATWPNMDKPQKPYTELNKSDTKDLLHLY